MLEDPQETRPGRCSQRIYQRGPRFLLCLGLLTGWVQPAWAQMEDGAQTSDSTVPEPVSPEPPLPETAAPTPSGRTPGQDVADLDLESLLEQTVVSSTKQVQRGAQAPAVVSVVTRDEIVARGYTSLAEILRTVPGFFDVYDLATHNVGVRGINGGARASGNVLKLMIDGMPVDYRPTTGNFFGEELIPMEAVERVEIIRGPASALYGANAFLGVINVITRSGKDAPGARALLSGGFVRDRLAGGAGLLVGGHSDRIDVMVAGQVYGFNRGGLAVPLAPGPIGPPPPGGSISSRGSTGPDNARPMSLIARSQVQAGQGTVSLLASLQNLDVNTELQDVWPLSHGTRMSLLNQNYRLSYALDINEQIGFQVSGLYLNAKPTVRDVVDLDRPDTVLLNREGVEGHGFAAELRWTPAPLLSVLLAADFVAEDHLLRAYDELWLRDLVSPSTGTILRSEGTIVPGPGTGRHRRFENLGGFVQAQVRPTEAWSAIAGARMDRHNIYGLVPTWRLGAVYAPPERPLSAKLLYGSSFKAPSAAQLYATPMMVLDVEGNPSLRSQYAHTLEASFGYRVSDKIELMANAFGTYVRDRVEFIQRGLFLEARNTGSEWVVGGEIDSRFLLGPGFRARAAASIARTVNRTLEGVPTGTPAVLDPLFPMVQIHGSLDYTLPWWAIRWGVELSLIGMRTSSQANALRSGSVYTLPGYAYVSASVSLPDAKLLGERVTRVSFRVNNLLNSTYSEPGFGGVDVPALGINGMLVWSQEI